MRYRRSEGLIRGRFILDLASAYTIKDNLRMERELQVEDLNRSMLFVSLSGEKTLAALHTAGA